jgi:hypothetical protein
VLAMTITKRSYSKFIYSKGNGYMTYHSGRKSDASSRRCDRSLHVVGPREWFHVISRKQVKQHLNVYDVYYSYFLSRPWHVLDQSCLLSAESFRDLSG